VSVLAYYFGWPAGAVWSNLLASAICGILIWWRLRVRMITHHLEQMAQRDQHHAEHMNALSLDTPGGLAAVMDEVRRAVTAAESAHEDIKALGVIGAKAQTPRRGATELRKTASGKTEPAAPEASGMGARITPKASRGKP